MKPRLHLVVLTGVLLVTLPLTYSNFRGARVDSVSVHLGVSPDQRPEARAVDDEVLKAMDRGYFGSELRERLNKPNAIVQLDAFLIDRCEVRQIDFERFAKWKEGLVRTPVPRDSQLWSASTGDRIAGRLKSPATGVTASAAAQYCAAMRGRLPWAEELEAAGGGVESRLYPWGNEYVPDAWPYENPDRNSQQECAVHASSSTPDGIHDLASNAMEWSMGPLADKGLHGRLAHGAPALRTSGRPLYALNAAWVSVDPETRSHHLGFRCVYPLGASGFRPWSGTRTEVALVRSGHYRVGLANDIRLARLAALFPPELHDRFAALVEEPAGGETLRIGACEVTRSEYAAFLRDPMVKLGWFGNENEPDGLGYLPAEWESQLEDSSLPVTGINWWAADAYARWSGGRLPTVDEWQRIATGKDGTIYPWGDSYSSDRLVAGDSPDSRVQRCGLANDDVTDDGVFDLAGNVSEWTRTIDFQSGRLSMWVVGGNWLLPGPELSRSVSGRRVPLSHQSQAIGLRVLYD